jgi:hypothetical protein
MLTGQAKKHYQREYMRKKRAGEPTAKPKVAKEWQPTYSVVLDIERWVKHPWRQAQRDITKGLTLTLPEEGFDTADIAEWNRQFPAYKQAVLDHVCTDAEWQEAFRRYRAHKERLKAEHQYKAQRRNPDLRFCLICSDCEGMDQRRFIDTSWHCGDPVCETCIDKLTEALARARSS